MPRAHSWAGALALLLGACLPAHAALEIVALRVGYRGAEPGKAIAQHGGVEGRSTWLPVELVVKNPDPEPYRGSLRVDIGAEYRNRVEHALDLEPGAQQRLRLSVLYPGQETWARVSFRPEGGRWKTLRAMRSTQDLQQGFALPSFRSPLEPLILVVRGSDALATQLKVLQGRFTLDEDAKREWTAVELEGVQGLPEEAGLLHYVSVIVLDDVELERLSTAQQRALLAWVDEGGRLAVTTLKASGSGGLLGKALPGSAGEVSDRTTLPELSPICYGETLPIRPRELRVLKAGSGDVSWLAGSTEAGVLHRDYGKGAIVRLGFRLSKVRFPVRPFVRELIARRHGSRVPARLADRLLKDSEQALRMATRRKIPSPWFVVSVLVFYFLLGVAIPFAIGQRFKRLELVWVWIGISTGIATGVVLYVGQGLQEDTRAVRLTLVSGSGGPCGLRTSAVGVFSRDGGLLDLELAEPAAVALSGEADARQSIATGARSYRLSTHPQDTSLFALQQAQLTPGRVRLVQTGPSSARVERHRDLTLLGAWAYDSDGAPIAKLELPVELRAGPGFVHPELRVVLAEAKSRAMSQARAARRPLLLYRYEGKPLFAGELPEVGLDFGYAWPEPGWGRWGKRAEISPLAGAALERNGMHVADLVSPLPDPSRDAILRITESERYYGYRQKPFPLVWRQGEWTQPPREFEPLWISVSPFGVARLRVAYPEGYREDVTQRVSFKSARGSR